MNKVTRIALASPSKTHFPNQTLPKIITLLNENEKWNVRTQGEENSTQKTSSLDGTASKLLTIK